MCGVLKHESIASKIGNLVSVHNPANGKEGTAKWSGFAQEEKLGYWKKESAAVLINIKADSIQEKNVELKVRGKIQAIGLKKEVLVNGRLIGKAGEVKILTREAANLFEKKIHPRWPIVKMKDGTVQMFGPKDMLAGPGLLLLMGD